MGFEVSEVQASCQSLSLSVCVCGGVCVYMYTYTSVSTYVFGNPCMKARGQPRLSFSGTPSTSESRYFIALWLTRSDQLTTQPQESLSQFPKCWDYQCMPSYRALFCRFWGSNSGPWQGEHFIDFLLSFRVGFPRHHVVIKTRPGP